MLKNVFRAIFGTRNLRLLKGYYATVNQINAFEAIIEGLNDNELRAKTVEFKQRFNDGAKLHDLLPEVFAVCREASRRTLNMRHFDVQLIGGMVLNDNKIAEMSTGEGKTLAATLPTYLNAITGNGVHVVTVNDYLASRDAESVRPLFEFLGLSVGINLPGMYHEQKKAAYNCDITYGTNNEFGFDYLRDNMVFSLDQKVQRKLSFAIIDEVDSILIDEARTPLIISGPAEESAEIYTKLNTVPAKLIRQQTEDGEGDFWVDEKNHNVLLSESGHEKVEQILVDMQLIKPDDSLYNVHNIGLMHHLIAAMRAHFVYIKDQHYVVQDDEVIIVDEFTGRMMSGRRWSDGLHQAVEAKEGVTIQRENQTLASITFQNYFRMYDKLSGMTGTADTEAFEFQQIYGLETVVVPTNRQMIRQNHHDKIYMNNGDKYEAIIEDIKECSKKGQPVLVGTTSVENSEIISKALSKAQIKHDVLNAKQHAREADIIAQAGFPGNVTIATNMAGRGTDIILGGNPKALVDKVRADETLSEEQQQQQISQIMQDWKDRNQKVLDAGGLYIVGTERHESRRVDNQLRGRSGRQGDPGSSRFYLSFDDSLLRIFGGERMRGMMQRVGIKEGEAIEHRLLSRSIESAQRKVEGHNFDTRKQLLEYDDVSNDQRKVIYAQRDEVLASNDLSPISHNMVRSVIGELFDTYIPPKSYEEQWDITLLEKILKDDFLLAYSISDKIADNNPEQVRTQLVDAALAQYQHKITEFKNSIASEIQQFAQSSLAGDQENWNLDTLDNFLLQNGINPLVSFTDLASELSRDQLLEKFYAETSHIADKQVTKFERDVLLQNIDYYWREHLTQLEHLRQGIGLRGYAQKNPKQEYKKESFNLFAQMLDNIRQDIAKLLLSAQLQSATNQPNNTYFVDEELISTPLTNNSQANHAQISRNAKCPCGSGLKYKHCHGKL